MTLIYTKKLKKYSASKLLLKTIKQINFNLHLSLNKTHIQLLSQCSFIY